MTNEENKPILVKNKNYGKVVGKYTILEYFYKSDGKYIVKCNKCGWVNTKGSRIYDLKRTDPDSKCNHVGAINPDSKDRSGEIHGKYTIIEFANDRDSQYHKIYKCRCNDCGNIFYLTITAMDCTTPGTICEHKSLPQAIIGQTIGKYRILDYIGKDQYNNRIYKVQCVKCGYINNNGMRLSNIILSESDDKCCHSNISFIDYINMRFYQEQLKEPDKKVICVEIKDKKYI